MENLFGNENPPVGFHFEVFVGFFMTDMCFSEVSGLEMELEIAMEVKEGGNNNYSYSLPGRTKYGDLVLKRGVITSVSPLYQWFESTISLLNSETIQPLPIVINLLDENGSPVVSWYVSNAYPKKMTVSSMNAKASGESAIMIETLTLSYSEFVRL